MRSLSGFFYHGTARLGDLKQGLYFRELLGWLDVVEPEVRVRALMCGCGYRVCVEGVSALVQGLGFRVMYSWHVMWAHHGASANMRRQYRHQKWASTTENLQKGTHRTRTPIFAYLGGGTSRSA